MQASCTARMPHHSSHIQTHPEDSVPDDRRNDQRVRTKLVVTIRLGRSQRQTGQRQDGDRPRSSHPDACQWLKLGCGGSTEEKRSLLTCQSTPCQSTKGHEVFITRAMKFSTKKCKCAKKRKQTPFENTFFQDGSFQVR